MSTIILNIGLDGIAVDESFTNGRLNPLTARRAMRAAQALRAQGLVYFNNRLVRSDTEDTLVIEVAFGTAVRTNAVIAQAVYQAAVDLQQDCIATWWPEQQAGRLIGPKEADWGAFDPARFITLDSTRLA